MRSIVTSKFTGEKSPFFLGFQLKAKQVLNHYSSFFSRKTLVWENDVILGLRVLREMIYNSTKRIICIHKGSACCGLSCKDFEFTAAMKRKSKQCFNLEENLKLYSNGKKILCRYFFKTQEGSENWHKPRRKANVIALARKPMCEITCVPIFIGTDLRRGGGGGGWVSSLEPLKFKKKWDIQNSPTWPKNTGNPNSEGLNLKHSPGTDAPRIPYSWRGPPWTIRISNPIIPLIRLKIVGLIRQLGIQSGLDIVQIENTVTTLTWGNFLTLSFFAILDFFVWSCLQNKNKTRNM